MMFALIMPGKKSVTDKNVDVYMAPLIEELQELWEGIDCLDGSQRNSNAQTIKLHDMLSWTVNDLPAYGLISGQVTKGHRGCPVCGPNVATRCSKVLKKIVYLGHRRQLPPMETTEFHFLWTPRNETTVKEDEWTRAIAICKRT